VAYNELPLSAEWCEVEVVVRKEAPALTVVKGNKRWEIRR